MAVNVDVNMAVNVDVFDEYGYTALHRAAQLGDEPFVVQLVNAGANPEARTVHCNETPLHLAAAAGHAGLLHLLITPNTLDSQDRSQQTPLQLAVVSRRLEAAEVLVAAGAALWAAEDRASPVCTAVSRFFLQPSVATGDAAQLPLLLLNAALADPSIARRVAQALRSPHGPLTNALHRAATWAGRSWWPSWWRQGLTGTYWTRRGPLRSTMQQQGAMHTWCRCWPPPPTSTCWLGVTAEAPSMQQQQAGSKEAVAALLAAGATVGLQDSKHHNALFMAASGSRPEFVALLLDSLSRECLQQKGPQESQQQQQQQRKHQQQGHAELVGVVIAAVAPLAADGQHGVHCSRLLGMVLDVLGPEVAGEVCLQVTQQLQQSWQQRQDASPGRLPGDGAPMPQASYLAEALLLGWVEGAERLHEAQQPVLARLRRLLPGVGIPGQQEALQGGQQDSQRPLAFLTIDRMQLQQQLMKEAALAAEAGEQQEALRLLGEFAAVHLQLRQAVWRGQGQSIEHRRPLSAQQEQQWRLEMHDRLAWFSAAPIQSALQDAARAHMQTSSGAGEPEAHAQVAAASFRSPAAYTTFLAAWVAARRQLQQLPQEVTRTVVAAVTVAMEREQQQQGSGLGEASQGQEELPLQLSGLLLLGAGGAAAAPGSG